MSMRSLGALLLTVFVGSVAAGEGPGLGIEADPREVAAWDIDIAADGTGLPPGSGTATDGAAVYARHCLACHGAWGSGGLNDALVGGQGTLDGPAPLRTVGSFWPFAATLFDYVRRAMPYLEPRSLSNDEVYALTAYLLFLNGIIAEKQTMDARTLAKVRMPNRDNFIPAYPAAQLERIQPEAPE
ncbi:MAG: cytochrome c [Gammaproteobacteria bacterium]|nr:cytochrome c [Gammaproteobacteria bacterium]MDE0364449.1 cytochrome c [Gammaproteobacteria bacterium]